MNIAQIENNIKALVEHLASGELATNDFIYELLLAYGHRNSTISMLKTGHYNIAKEPDEIIFKRHLYFKQIESEALHSEIDRMKNEKLVLANRTRFVIVTNFHTLLAVDTKTGDSLDIVLTELPKKFDFFLPWAGMEKAVYQGENPADVKAVEKMAKLFDLIKTDNFTEENLGDKAALHNLNVFLTRLLFCFFAEDTEIFADNQFSNAIQAHTNEDGSDLTEYLNRLFSVLNTSGDDRGVLPEYLANFPYVNGGLFSDDVPAPKFSQKSRRMLIECGSELNWSDINPDIFGSMIQAVVHPDQRGGMGMHYTSVTNIMKVIEPLFLNDFYEELEKVSSNPNKLQKLQQRLGEIKIFDPACGSGNFLIIAYKELRRLEMELLNRWQELELGKTGQVLQPYSVIKLAQFHGIELDDFAHEVAILSLWLAEHQMNLEFKAEFGDCPASLPLKIGGGIVVGNACLLEWESVCSSVDNEVYLCGNPPYVGQRNQSKNHQNDMETVFHGMNNFKNLDYIACWFLKAANYIQNGGKFGFVTTNSICQGVQVEMLWPHILNLNCEIYFAHKNIKWTNSAKNSAGVTVCIIGIRIASEGKKYLYDETRRYQVNNISPYLIPGENIIATKRKSSISGLPPLEGGNQPREGGYLILSDAEKNELIATEPKIKQYIRPLCGSIEFINSIPRWCIWVRDNQVVDAEKIPALEERFKKIRALRETGNTVEKNFINYPYRFVMVKEAKLSQIIVPVVSSERRQYLPLGFVDKNVIILNSASAIYDSEAYVFGILSSRIHMVWVKAVAGQLETRIRYTSGVCYNSFPLPALSSQNKDEITALSMQILSAREDFPNKTMSDLYDPEGMPKLLLAAHQNLDTYIESLYRNSPFANDADRLTELFRLYKEMSENA